MSSLEALSQGLAVIAGLDTWNQQCNRGFFQSEELPWYASKDGQLLEDLRRLVVDANLRSHLSKKSRHFMATCWNSDRIVKHLLCIIRTANTSKHQMYIQLKKNWRIDK